MVVDARFEALKPLRSHLGMLLTPLYNLADLPVRAWDTLYLQLTSRADLIAENERLRAEALLAKRKLQKLAALTESERAPARVAQFLRTVGREGAGRRRSASTPTPFPSAFSSTRASATESSSASRCWMPPA